MSTMLKRLLSLAVALVMIIGLMPWNAASVYAAEETTADITWYNAEQSEFTIDTAAELLGLAQLAKENNFAGKTIILGDDISLVGIAWTPIGTSATPFAGTFDGNHKTISDMSVTTGGGVGFFAYLCGTVKDLTVSGSIKSTAANVGGIAAYIKSGASLKNVVSNVNIEPTVGSNIGGIVGVIWEKGTYTIEDCSYNGTFTGTQSDNVGGILGNANGLGSTIAITGCSVTGSISAKAQVGGFIGNTHNTNTIVISGSTNEAAITGTGNSVGGLIGTNGASALTIENSSNSGAVTGKVVGAGGILGGFSTTGSVAISGTTNTGTWYNANATTFTISTVDELLQFAELVNAKNSFSGKTVNLSTDLDLTNVAWTPIGLHVDAVGTTVGTAFAGTFNGNSNTISGMNAAPSGKAGSWGFFGQIAGTVKNFTVSGSIEGTASQVGGVTGALRSGAKLENVTSNVDLTITGNNVGGIAGRVEQTATYTISGCTYGGTITVTGGSVGGILGAVNAACTLNISGSAATKDAKISATGSAVGGILGNANNKASTFIISNCTIAEGAEISGNTGIGGIVGNAHNTNTFTISGTNSADISGNEQIGGIVGLLGSSTMTVQNSVNNGDISSVEGHVAGVVGQMNADSKLTVTGCTNNGVIISGGNEFGGIVGTGRSTLTIENTRNNGAVTAMQGNDSIYYGAIVGSLYGDSEEKPCVVTFGGEEGVTYLPICSDQAYSRKVTEEGEAGSFVTINGECTVYDPNPLGSENNPIIITEATELTSISVEAGKAIYYAINGQLNDSILTIAGNENVTITLNGGEFSETAVLAGTPVNVLVITNNSEETITLAAEISRPGCTDHSYGEGEQTKAPTCTEDGVKTFTCSACGESYTESVDKLGHSYENGKCTVCDAKDPNYVAASISLSGSLNLLDKVIPIYTVNVEKIADGITVAECGVLLHDDADKDSQVIETIVLECNEENKKYVGQSKNGIDARDMAKSQFAVAYAKLSDGTTVYATNEEGEQVIEFSPLIYCQKAVKSEDEAITEDVKTLCAAMMHYGAAAQKVQYGTSDENLMNKDFDAVEYNPTVLGDSVFSANTRTINGMKLKSVTMALKGAISYIVKYNVDSGLSGEELWVEYTLGNGEAVTAKLVEGSEGEPWVATLEGIAPKDLGKTLTVKPYYVGENDEKVYGGELVFSGYEYTRIVTKNAAYGEDVKELAKALAMYVYYANKYAEAPQGQ